MPYHLIVEVVVLQYYAFWWGATLVFCGIGGELDDGASPKAVGCGFILLIGAVVSILALGGEVHRIALPLPAALVTALPGIWMGLQSWNALQPTPATKNLSQ